MTQSYMVLAKGPLDTEWSQLVLWGEDGEDDADALVCLYTARQVAADWEAEHPGVLCRVVGIAGL